MSIEFQAEYEETETTGNTEGIETIKTIKNIENGDWESRENQGVRNGREDRLKRKNWRNRKGSAMIAVICVMAVLTVLALSLLLAVSVLLNSSTAAKSQEQSRILAVSFSQEIERQLTGEPGAGGGAAEAESLPAYLRDQIGNNRWPYYDQDTYGHTATFAYRTFTLAGEGLDRIGDLELLMYWTEETAEDDAQSAVLLHMTVTATVDGKASSITTEYQLKITKTESGDEIWNWNRTWRE